MKLTKKRISKLLRCKNQSCKLNDNKKSKSNF